MPATQAVPHEPQLLPSTFSSTQTLAQFDNPVGQPQLPLMHASAPGQAVPQPPQFCGSLLAKMHCPLQKVWPVGQLIPAPFGQPTKSSTNPTADRSRDARPAVNMSSPKWKRSSRMAPTVSRIPDATGRVASRQRSIIESSSGRLTSRSTSPMRYKLLALSLSVAAVGCGSDSTTDPAGPVMLVRIMVQDAQPFGVRGVAIDLLDTPGSPLSTAVACDANHPCVVRFPLAAGLARRGVHDRRHLHRSAGRRLAPLTPPERRGAGRSGRHAAAPRLQQAAAVDDPGRRDVVEVDDASGTPVPGTALWDPSGSPTVSSDPILMPYGPALVFKPNAPFNAHAQYTIKVNASLVTDRAGNPMADQNGIVVDRHVHEVVHHRGAALVAADHRQRRHQGGPDGHAGRDRAARLQRAGGVDDDVHGDHGRRAGAGQGVRRSGRR